MIQKSFLKEKKIVQIFTSKYKYGFSNDYNELNENGQKFIQEIESKFYA